MKAGRSGVKVETAAASAGGSGAARIDAVRRQLAEVQAEHDDACARRSRLQEELRSLGDRLRDVEARMRTARHRGEEPSPRDELETLKLNEQLATKTQELNANEQKIADKSVELRELQTVGLQRAFAGGSIEEVLRVQRELETAIAEATAIQSAIDEQRALLQAASTAGEALGNGDDASLSDLLAKAALGQADAAEVDRRRSEIAERQAAAEKAGAEHAARRSVIESTIQGLARALGEKEAAVAELRRRADLTFAQFVSAEQDATVARYAELTREISEALRRMLALDLLGRPLGVPPLLNENWASCFCLPAVRREVDGVQERPTMPGVLTAGVLLSQAKERYAAQTEERDRLRERGVTLV